MQDRVEVSMRMQVGEVSHKPTERAKEAKRALAVSTEVEVNLPKDRTRVARVRVRARARAKHASKVAVRVVPREGKVAEARDLVGKDKVPDHKDSLKVKAKDKVKVLAAKDKVKVATSRRDLKDKAAKMPPASKQEEVLLRPMSGRPKLRTPLRVPLRHSHHHPSKLPRLLKLDNSSTLMYPHSSNPNSMADSNRAGAGNNNRMEGNRVDHKRQESNKADSSRVASSNSPNNNFSPRSSLNSLHLPNLLLLNRLPKRRRHRVSQKLKTPHKVTRKSNLVTFGPHTHAPLILLQLCFSLCFFTCS